MIKTPKFWYQKPSWQSVLLRPLALAYGLGVNLSRLLKTSPPQLNTPVICVGNLTAGGAGKTPVVHALLRLLQTQGMNPQVVTRGYGGNLEGPILVSFADHQAADVGDEALLLGALAPTWIAKKRIEGLRKADEEADVIVMDDGYQSQPVHVDLNMVVVDGRMGFGNQNLLPAGPLREPIKTGLNRADVVIVVGEDIWGCVKLCQSLVPNTPVLKATLKPNLAVLDSLYSKPLIAFAGIGYPEKFFRFLQGLGLNVIEAIGFADHHPYSEQDLRSLVESSKSKNALLITTEKDWVRVPKALQPTITPLPVELEFSDPNLVREILSSKLD